LTDSRNPEGVDIDFDEERLTTVVIGQNGAGKSNLIEASPTYSFRRHESRSRAFLRLAPYTAHEEARLASFMSTKRNTSVIASIRFDFPAPFWPMTTVVAVPHRIDIDALQVLESVNVNVGRDASGRFQFVSSSQMWPFSTSQQAACRSRSRAIGAPEEVFDARDATGFTQEAGEIRACAAHRHHGGSWSWWLSPWGRGALLPQGVCALAFSIGCSARTSADAFQAARRRVHRWVLRHQFAAEGLASSRGRQALDLGYGGAV